jgi:hypothetical protein
MSTWQQTLFSNAIVLKQEPRILQEIAKLGTGKRDMILDHVVTENKEVLREYLKNTGASLKGLSLGSRLYSQCLY